MTSPKLVCAPLLAGLLGLAAPAVFAACGDDSEAARNYPSTGRPRQDGGRFDGGPRRDASGPDHEIFSGDLYLCGYDDEDEREFEGNGTYSEIAAATDQRGLALAYQDAAGSLFLAGAPVMGDALDPVRVVASGEAPESPALVANAGGFLLAFRSGDRLRARALPSAAADPERASALRDLTDSLATAEEGGEPFALVAQPDSFVAAFLEEGAGERALRLVRLDGAGMPDGPVRALPEIAERGPLDLHLADIGMGRLLLAWFERDAMAAGRVMGVRLTRDFELDGEPIQLSKHAVAEPRFDLAAHGRSAGLLYQAKDGDVREAIKFRRIEPSGAAEQAVLNVVNAPGRAVAGSIAPFGQGYAIAFRELPSLGVQGSQIKVAFVNQFGRVVHEAALGGTSEQGGRTSVTATTDGHVLVGYTSSFPSATSTHTIKLHCPGALILCGG